MSDGFVSSAWGPSAWLFIHVISLSYPVCPTTEDLTHYSTWFEQLEHVLPCVACRKNFNLSLKELEYSKEAVFQSKDSFSRFAHRLHEHISGKLKKNTLTRYDDMVKFYDNLRATSCGTDTSGESGCMRPIKTVCTIHFHPAGTGGILFD
jgi:hypothetical protein